MSLEKESVITDLFSLDRVDDVSSVVSWSSANVTVVSWCRELDMNGVMSSSSGNDTYVEIFL